MDPSEKFQWSLRSLRTLCKISFQDIFVKKYRYGIGYYLTISFWIFTIVNYCYTMAFYVPDSLGVFESFGFFVGVTQVRYEYTYKIRKFHLILIACTIFPYSRK